MQSEAQLKCIEQETGEPSRGKSKDENGLSRFKEVVVCRWLR